MVMAIASSVSQAGAIFVRSQKEIKLELLYAFFVYAAA
jgi:hypothetical protein